MYVYKITNTQNGKVYIGQTIRTPEQRFQRHIRDAERGCLDTHFSRALTKYGKDAFSQEVIDTAESQEELNRKEEYWIRFYNACEEGYNTSPGGCACGGNTYANLTNMDEIRRKLSLSKMGGKNPHSKKVVMVDVLTGERTVFACMREAADYLGLSSHVYVSRRCLGKTLAPLFGRYNFEYYNDEGVTTIESTACADKQVEQLSGETPDGKVPGSSNAQEIV